MFIWKKGDNEMLNNNTKPDFKKCAVLVIDMQNDFVLPQAVSEIKGSYEIKNKIADILKAARKKEIFIIHIVRLYEKSGANADLCRKEALKKGIQIVVPYTEGADILKDLKPNEKMLDFNLLIKGDFQQLSKKEWVMYKSRWGAFYKTDLENFLKSKEINTLIILGCNFPNCTRTTIYEASERDFKIVAVYDAISQVYEKGLRELEAIGVCLLNEKEIIHIFESKNMV